MALDTSKPSACMCYRSAARVEGYAEPATGKKRKNDVAEVAVSMSPATVRNSERDLVGAT